MFETTTCECDDCGTTFEYTLSASGQIPDGCPDCDSDNVGPTTDS